MPWPECSAAIFAVLPRDTTYFTPNSNFYVVNYAGFTVSMSREVDNEQWNLQIKGAVKTSMSLGSGDILNRDSYDQVSTLMCIDTLPGGDKPGQRKVARKRFLD